MNYTKVCRAAWNYVSFYDSAPAQAIQWNVGHVPPVNITVKLSAANRLDKATLAFVQNQQGHYGIGPTMSSQETTLEQRLYPELVSGALSPSAFISQMQAARQSVPVPPPLTKIPAPPKSCR